MTDNRYKFIEISGWAAQNQENVDNSVLTESTKVRPTGSRATIKPIEIIGERGSEIGQFYAPQGIAIGNDDTLYVADTLNNRIQRISVEGGVDAIGAEGGEPGRFKSPSGIALDKHQCIYITDKGNNRLQKFSNNAALLFSICTRGSGTMQLNGPGGLAIDHTNNIYVADTGNNRFVSFTSIGRIRPLPFLTNTDIKFSRPGGIAIRKDGIIALADTWNHRILIYDNTGKLLQ
ncbi:MAG: NHL repeat-containing protein, partial [bacterium]